METGHWWVPEEFYSRDWFKMDELTKCLVCAEESDLTKVKCEKCTNCYATLCAECVNFQNSENDWVSRNHLNRDCGIKKNYGLYRVEYKFLGFTENEPIDFTDGWVVVDELPQHMLKLMVPDWDSDYSE
jgi:hypothetical protein